MEEMSQQTHTDTHTFCLSVSPRVLYSALLQRLFSDLIQAHI